MLSAGDPDPGWCKICLVAGGYPVVGGRHKQKMVVHGDTRSPARRATGQAVHAGRLGKWGSSSTTAGNKRLRVAIVPVPLNVLVHEEDHEEVTFVKTGMLVSHRSGSLRPIEGDKRAGREVSHR
jgi:hypothetical protein